MKKSKPIPLNRYDNAKPRLTNGFVTPSVVGWYVNHGFPLWLRVEHKIGVSSKSDKRMEGECTRAERHLLPEGDYVWYVWVLSVGRRARMVSISDDMGCGWFIVKATREYPR